MSGTWASADYVADSHAYHRLTEATQKSMLDLGACQALLESYLKGIEKASGSAKKIPMLILSKEITDLLLNYTLEPKHYSHFAALLYFNVKNTPLSDKNSTDRICQLEALVIVMENLTRESCGSKKLTKAIELANEAVASFEAHFGNHPNLLNIRSKIANAEYLNSNAYVMIASACCFLWRCISCTGKQEQPLPETLDELMEQALIDKTFFQAMQAASVCDTAHPKPPKGEKPPPPPGPKPNWVKGKSRAVEMKPMRNRPPRPVQPFYDQYGNLHYSLPITLEAAGERNSSTMVVNETHYVEAIDTGAGVGNHINLLNIDVLAAPTKTVPGLEPPA